MNDYQDIYDTLSYCHELLKEEMRKQLSEAVDAFEDCEEWKCEVFLKNAEHILKQGKILSQLMEKNQNELQEASMFNEDPTKELEDLIDSLHD